MTKKFILSQEDGTVEGGNKRGNGSVDLQMSRSNANQVASAFSSAILGGINNIASGNYSTSFGNQNVASGIESTAFGAFNTAIGNTSVAFGNGATSSGPTSFAQGTSTASGTNAISLGAGNNASSGYSVVSGGSSNSASTGTHATVVGGQFNTSSGQYSVSGGYSSEATGEAAIGIGRHAHARNTWAVAFGNNNTVNNLGSSILGGDGNSISSNFSIISGGSSNSVSTGTHATVVGGNSNISSGQYSVSGGNDCNATGLLSVALGNATASGTASVALGGGNSNTASNSFTLSTGNYVEAYLYGQKAHGVRLGPFGNAKDSQISELIATKFDDLTTGGTTVLSLDGTGTTNLIIPSGNNRVWNVVASWVAVVIGTSGTTTGVNVGDVITQCNLFAFKKIGGISSIVGSVTNVATHNDVSMASASMGYTAGASQELALTFTAPTFGGGGSVSLRIVNKLMLTEVAY